MNRNIPKRIQLKLFFDDSVQVPIKAFIPVFHKWIQQQNMGDLLIDVHNYSHIHHGPGILLVAHESDFSIDLAGGRTGLIYRRKRNIPGDLNDLLSLLLQRAVNGALRLQQDESLPDKVRFRTDEIELSFPDRLAFPNAAAVYQRIEPVLTVFTGHVFGDGNSTIERIDNDPRDPLMVRIRILSPPSLAELAGRIGISEVSS